MKSAIRTAHWLAVLSICISLHTSATAQDTHYAPRGEQIPSPDCLTLKDSYQTAISGGFTACSRSRTNYGCRT